MWSNKLFHSKNSLHKDLTINKEMRKQIALFLHHELLDTTQLFARCTLDCIAEVALRLEVSVYFSEDVIVYQGDVGREMYFIKRGACEVLRAEHPKGFNEPALSSPRSERFRTVGSDVPCLAAAEHLRLADSILPEDEIKLVTRLRAGQYFGEIALLKHSMRTVSVQATEITECVVLQKKDFSELCEEYKDLYEMFERSSCELLASDNARDKGSRAEAVLSGTEGTIASLSDDDEDDCNW